MPVKSIPPWRAERWRHAVLSRRVPAFAVQGRRLDERRMRKAVVQSTDLVVEGFPRSGNSFLVAVLRMSQAPNLRLAHHLHSAAQLRAAAKMRKPCILLIRQPDETCSSLRVHSPHLSMRRILERYILYHKEAAKFLDQVIVSGFQSTTQEPGGLVQAINRRWPIRLADVPTGERFTVRVAEEVASAMPEGLTASQIRQKIALPGEDRRKQKAYALQEYQAANNRWLVAAAEQSYEAIAVRDWRIRKDAEANSEMHAHETDPVSSEAHSTPGKLGEKI